MTTTLGGQAPRRPLDTAMRVAVESDRQQVAEYYRSHYEKAAIQQLERQLDSVHQQLADYYARHYAEAASQQVDTLLEDQRRNLEQQRRALEEQRRDLERAVQADLDAKAEDIQSEARRRVEIERLQMEAEFDRKVDAVEETANRQLEIERLQIEADFDRKLDFMGAEAERQLENERLRLERELQQRLDQVGAEVDQIERINGRTQKRLKARLALSVLLLLGVACGSAGIFVTRVQPENQRLRTMAEQVLAERGRFEQKIRDQEEALQRSSDQLKAARLDLEQARKQAATNATTAPPSSAPGTPSSAAQGKQPSLGAAATPPASNVSAKRSHHGGSEAPDSLARPAKGGPCKCAPSDPLCGCLN